MIFDEEDQWDWSQGTEAGNVDDSVTIEFTIGRVPDDQEVTSSEEAGTPGTPPVATPTWQGGPGTPAATTPTATPAWQSSPSTLAATPVGVQFVTPPHFLGALRFRAVDDVVGPGSPPGYAIRDLGDERLYAMSAEELASLAQAKKEAC